MKNMYIISAHCIQVCTIQIQTNYFSFESHQLVLRTYSRLHAKFSLLRRFRISDMTTELKLGLTACNLRDLPSLLSLWTRDLVFLRTLFVPNCGRCIVCPQHSMWWNDTGNEVSHDLINRKYVILFQKVIASLLCFKMFSVKWELKGNKVGSERWTRCFSLFWVRGSKNLSGAVIEQMGESHGLNTGSWFRKFSTCWGDGFFSLSNRM